MDEKEIVSGTFYLRPNPLIANLQDGDNSAILYKLENHCFEVVYFRLLGVAISTENTFVLAS